MHFIFTMLVNSIPFTVCLIHLSFSTGNLYTLPPALTVHVLTPPPQPFYPILHLFPDPGILP